MIYPATRHGDVVETHFGAAVAYPYRWLPGTDLREGLPHRRQRALGLGAASHTLTGIGVTRLYGFDFKIEVVAKLPA